MVGGHHLPLLRRSLKKDRYEREENRKDMSVFTGYRGILNMLWIITRNS